MTELLHKRQTPFICFGLGDDRFTWRGVYLLFALYFGGMLLAALLAPWVYYAVQFWNNAAPSDLSTYLARKGFPDYFDRLRYLPVVLGLPWLLRVTQLWSWRGLGFTLSMRSLREFFIWAVLGIVMLEVVIFVQMETIYVTDEARYGFGGAGNVLLKAAFSALTVALLEQLVFRGLVFRLFYSALRPIPAIVVAAAFFAYVHFKMPDSVWDASGGEVTPFSGFFVAWWSLLAITQDFQWVPFLNLLVLGVLHNVLFLRVRSLWTGVGLHAGFVFMILSYQKLFNTWQAPSPSFVGTERIVDGFLPAILMLGMTIILLRRPLAKPAKPEPVT